MAIALNRLRSEARDLIELVLVPGLAAVLPWRWCFRIFRWLCFHTWFLYRAPCERALAQAQARGWVDEPQRWIAERRLVTLIDHADYYLERSRSDAWMARHLRVEGTWPAANQAALLCTFHWGAGMWALRHASAARLKAHIIMATPQGAGFFKRSVARVYALRRIAATASALGRPIVDVSAPLRPLLRVLRNREQIVAVIDVPSDQVAASQKISLLGTTAHVPRALMRLAVDQAIPVTVFLTGICMNSGDRYLVIRNFGVHTDLDVLVREVFIELEHAITEHPSAWHFWSEADRFFR